ncbi:MAG: hypothetical protein MHMPM18_002585 [Marteilia pararefringens]
MKLFLFRSQIASKKKQPIGSVIDLPAIHALFFGTNFVPPAPSNLSKTSCSINGPDLPPPQPQSLTTISSPNFPLDASSVNLRGVDNWHMMMLLLYYLNVGLLLAAIAAYFLPVHWIRSLLVKSGAMKFKSRNARVVKYTIMSFLGLFLISSIRDSHKYEIQYHDPARLDKEAVILKKFRAERNSYIVMSTFAYYMLLEKLLHTIMLSNFSSSAAPSTAQTPKITSPIAADDDKTPSNATRKQKSNSSSSKIE